MSLSYARSELVFVRFGFPVFLERLKAPLVFGLPFPQPIPPNNRERAGFIFLDHFRFPLFLDWASRYLMASSVVRTIG
jgi:hypothetical protein